MWLRNYSFSEDICSNHTFHLPVLFLIIMTLFMLLVQAQIIAAYREEEELLEHPLTQLVLPFIDTVTMKSGVIFNCSLTSQLSRAGLFVFVLLPVSLLPVIHPECESLWGSLSSCIVTRAGASPTLGPIMVLETLTFLPRSFIAWGKRRHVRITTATWTHAWITRATWSICPWLQAAERASLFSHTPPPPLRSLLSFLCSAPLFDSVVVLSLDEVHR